MKENHVGQMQGYLQVQGRSVKRQSTYTARAYDPVQDTGKWQELATVVINNTFARLMPRPKIIILFEAWMWHILTSRG